MPKNEQIFKKIRDQLKYRIDIIIITLLAILALTVRIVNLEGFPVWSLDEGDYVQLGWNIFHGYWGDKIWAPHFFPPLYPVLLGLLETLFGRSYFVARTLGVAFGTISVVILYLIGMKLYNRFVGVSAALLLAIAGLFINRMVVMDNGVELFFLLTVFSYIKSKETKKSNWIYLSAIFAGLAFLSKYQGIVAIIFLIIQSIIDKNTAMIKKGIPVFFLLSLIYPIIGAIQNWDAFIYDMFYQAAGRNIIIGGANTLDEGVAILMFGLFEGKWLYPPYIFTLLGFLSFFYIAARNSESDKLISINIVSLLLTLVIIVRIWWVFLIIILPFFCLAIAILIHDIIYRKTNWLLSLVLFSLISVPMFIKTMGYPPLYQRTVILVIFTIIFLLINLENNLDKSKFQTTNKILLFIIMIILVGNSLYDIKPIIENQNTDRYMVAEFLNKNTVEKDMVAVEPTLLPIINAFGVNYRHVLLNTTNDDLYLFPKELLSRFSYDVSIWNIKYIVLGQHWFNFEGIQTKGTEEVTNMILNDWIPVYKYGEYIVFLNPRFAINEYNRKVDNTSLEKWHFAYMKGTKDSTFNASGDRVTFATTTTEINGYTFWVRNVSVPTTNSPYFLLKYKVNNPKVRIVVKFLDSAGMELGSGKENPQKAWFIERNSSISYKIIRYNLSSLSPSFLDKNVAQIEVGMDSFNQFEYTYVLDVDFIGFV
ncbi:MAG: glycosyltransferase family 39 protein [Candidatus Methanoperedens sp.]|nr:glycosyltransferase family 39 protein [Candidatus Methanoperedens sp.]